MRHNALTANLMKQTQLLKTVNISCQAFVARLLEVSVSAEELQFGALQAAVVSSVEETV